MDIESRSEIAKIFSALDDVNLAVIKTVLEIAKLLPVESRKPVADALHELIEDHRRANTLFMAFVEKGVGGREDAE